MNATTTNPGGSGRSWLDAIEKHANRAADALFDGVEKLNKRIDAFAHAIAQRFFAKRG
jgi:hypothetical protein